MHTRFLFCNGPSDGVAIIEAQSGRTCTYGELDAASLLVEQALGGSKRLVFHVTDNKIASVASLLGSLRAGHAVALISPTMAGVARTALDELYRPDFIIGDKTAPKEEHYRPVFGLQDSYERVLKDGGNIHPDVGILLSTSGSTGSPKFVRLTNAGVVHNALAIREALSIGNHDVAYAHLQLHYSYGLSVLTSHLAAGAKIVLTNAGLMQPAFWADACTHEITHFPGVPFHYEMMLKLGFARLKLPKVAAMTQAGGRLALELQRKVHDWQSQNDGKFYVMYGQTEAAPRITTLQHEDLVAKIGSVGPALSGGKIDICGPDGASLPIGESGEVFYRGPNVMMGYATCRGDLMSPDMLGGRLATGDLGRLDAEGCLFITGRASRFAKIAGLRIGLDEIEQALGAGFATSSTDHKLIIWRLPTAQHLPEQVLDTMDSTFGIARSMCKVVDVDALPVRDNGKIDYKALQEMTS
jgi:acyl-CoA synthetase (AMP-forming)/AMP-acid ligase II